MGESELLFVCLFVCLIFTGSMSWMAPEVLELTPQYPSLANSYHTCRVE